MLGSLYVGTVSFLTIFTEGVVEKLIAAAIGLLIIPIGWLFLRLDHEGAQFPLDAIEEFGSAARYDIEVPASAWARQRSYEVAAQKFGADTIPPAQLEEICKLSPNSLLILTYGGSVVGYTDVYALRPEALHKFVTGEITERDFKPEMILAHPARGSASDLYLAGIMVVDCRSYEGKRQASMLIWALVELLARCFLGDDPVRLYALGWSDEGIALLEKANFTPVVVTKPRKDGCPLYTRSVTRSDCEQWLQPRNWAQFCRLTIACEMPPSRTGKRRRRPQLDNVKEPQGSKMPVSPAGS